MSLSDPHSNFGPRPDHPGRLVALLVFLIGIGILIFVFVAALHLFQSPVPGLEPLQAPGAAPPPPAASIGVSLADFGRKLLLLGVMTLAGSLLANKGAHLYFSTVYGQDNGSANATAVKNGSGGKVATVERTYPGASADRGATVHTATEERLGAPDPATGE